jgi:hypothetical protein
MRMKLIEIFYKNNLERSGIEPEAFRMRNGRSTTELHPLIFKTKTHNRINIYLNLFNRCLLIFLIDIDIINKALLVIRFIILNSFFFSILIY